MTPLSILFHLPSCQLHISVNRTAQIYLELHFCVELHTKKSHGVVVFTVSRCIDACPVMT